MIEYYDQFINLEYFFYQIYRFFYSIWQFGLGIFVGEGEVPAAGGFWGWFVEYGWLFKGLAEFMVLVFLTGIIYCIIRIFEVQKEEALALAKKAIVIDEEPFRNERWEVVLEYLDSASPADWRLAIIEADNMLDEMVKRLGYEGTDLGERLKAVEPSDFESLQNAWEAHKVRNKIVHEGVGFAVTRPEAERVIGLYEMVFREFNFI